jgi:hypothetical protein
MAVIRGANLWTCQAIGLDGTSGAYAGGTVNRSAIQWIRMQTFTSGDPLRYHSNGRIFDNASANPYSYYMPSLTVNASHDVVIGFSGSRGSEFIGAFHSGRKSNGVFTKPVLIQAGRASFPGFRWGDYTYTSLDTDAQTFWTVQQFATMHDIPRYSTWITAIKPAP